jgi:hypothetical protein
MNFKPFITIWSLLGLVVLGLALYRKIIMMHQEDELVHLAAGEEKLIPQQVALTGKISKIDRWGEILTLLTVVSGLTIAAAYLWGAWERSQFPR